MFSRTDDKITATQAAVFLNNTVLGAGILTLPRGVSEAVKTPDSWLSVLLGGVIVMAVVTLMVKISQQFPGKTIFQYAGKIVGRVPGALLCLLLVLYFLVLAGFEIRSLAEVTLFFLLEGTPIWAIILPFIWAGTYLVYGGINAIARVYQIAFPISIMILIICYTLSLRLFDIDNLRPVLGEGILPVIRGLKSTVLVYSGCEVVMTLVAFMQRPEKAVKAMLIGIGIPVGLYFVTVVMVIGGLSIDSVVTSTWPTIDLIRSFEITGFLFERMEFPLMVIWLMQMFCNFCSFFFQASLGISQIFRLKVHPVIYMLVPVIFISAMIPKSVSEVFSLGDFIGKSGLVLFLLLPVLLSIIWLIRTKGLKQHV
ncbi:spore gernimation protein [Paenibacillus sp. FSL R7-0273]|uniref:GerAB/ArcD/ProY family transporter n=1 Tax=Paenibacillus sp. FSL R7-0273 TaxID=1536772 RepID=UPI0004F9158C|nr:GerAB/ArcD/ProY family transporter [Paenibacillus sp. FSL R7-0273]AIQ45167.1 spore gernimation protein [Paenibacillus sp. FSL R7-0273]OMF85686.1 spore gernimation protein [Paenibacillus sp. FSL R7-0273]